MPNYFYTTDSLDPFLNLAIENWILNSLLSGQKAIFIWQNRPSVIIGRFQNPWLECNLEAMRKDGVKLVRRQSGGGCVYHDLGNINHSFLSSNKEIDKQGNIDVLLEVLDSFGVKAEGNKRFDIYLGGKKVSGSAFKQKKDRSFHHGTMLVESDLDKLDYYIHSPLKKIEGRSTPSVRAKVSNSQNDKKSINYKSYADSFSYVLGREFSSIFLSEEDALNKVEILEYYEKLQSYSWLIGETPKFSLKLESLLGEITLYSKKGHLESLELNGSSIRFEDKIPMTKDGMNTLNIDPNIKKALKTIAYKY